MKIIKKIDLINRIASGMAPERFICNDCLWCKGKSDKEHYYGENGKYLFNSIRLDELNDEVELLDEQVEIIEEDKKIEKINCRTFEFMHKPDKVRLLMNKINEIIDYLEDKDEQ